MLARAQHVYRQPAVSSKQSPRGAGAHPRRPLFALTGTKDPHPDPVKYPVGLATDGAIITMPPATLAAAKGRSGEKLPLLEDHAEDAEAAIEETLPDRHRPRRRRKQLQANGLARFERSWSDLLTKIGIQLNSAGPVDDASRPPKD